MGLFLESVSGAAIGCATYVPGYLKAMKDVCHKYGALIIFDEIMCGMDRTGTLFAWQEGVRPDIVITAKGLGAGYQPISVVMSDKVYQAFFKGTGKFIHGQTHQNMPIVAAVGLEVNVFYKKIIINFLKMSEKWVNKKRFKREIG